MSEILDVLFKFPIVQVDRDMEQEKANKAMSAAMEMPEMELVFGEAEYPYYDFVGISDRWLPTKESFEKALEKDFDACLVTFQHIGNQLVPWSKAKFKKEFSNFTKKFEGYRKQDQDVMFSFTLKQLKEIVRKAEEDAKEQENGDNKE